MRNEGETCVVSEFITCEMKRKAMISILVSSNFKANITGNVKENETFVNSYREDFSSPSNDFFFVAKKRGQETHV